VRLDDAVEFVKECGKVCTAEVAERFGMTPKLACFMLTNLAARAEIVRLHHGYYSADPELIRRELLNRLERLTPA
jgi:predicted transcriptional regulator of viral defense system